MIAPPYDERVAAEIRRRAPDRPGVYTFLDANGRVLYVGKSVHLRQRMLSYFHSHSGFAKHRRLLRAIDDFAIEETETELLALLLEDRLIKEHLPEYNVQQRDYPRYEYIRLSEDPFPTCRRFPHDSTPSERVWGPFKNRHFVDRLLGVVHEHLGLRSCTEAEPTRVCLQYDLGHCPGPCVGEISRNDYERIVDGVRSFLDGDESQIVRSLTKKMTRYARQRRFEAAEGIRETKGFARRFCARQRFVHRFRNERLVFVDEADSRAYAFEDGALRWHGDAGAAIPGDFEPQREADEDVRFIADRAVIVHRWLQRGEGRYERVGGLPQHRGRAGRMS